MSLCPLYPLTSLLCPSWPRPCALEPVCMCMRLPRLMSLVLCMQTLGSVGCARVHVFFFLCRPGYDLKSTIMLSLNVVFKFHIIDKVYTFVGVELSSSFIKLYSCGKARGRNYIFMTYFSSFELKQFIKFHSPIFFLVPVSEPLLQQQQRDFSCFSFTEQFFL